MGKNQGSKKPKEKPSDENSKDVEDQTSTEPDESVGDEQPAAEEKPKPSMPKDKKDFEEFIKISLVTGDLPANYQESFSEADKERFLEKFFSWKEAGKPKPSMPKSAEKFVEKIVKLYRARDRGEEFTYYVIEGQSLPTGIKRTPLYRKYDDGNGNMIEDKSMQIGTDESYVIPYDEKEFTRLVKKANRDTSKPRFYLVDGIGDSRIKAPMKKPENFTKSFDWLVSEVRAGRAI